MRVRILGAAAGGGFPQWNCNCENCARFRRGAIRATPRTQCSIAVSADGDRWCLLNASPDLPAHLRSLPYPADAAGTERTGPLDAIILTDVELDHCAGLLAIRETGPLALYATEPAHDWLFRRNAAFAAMLDRGRLNWRPIALAADPTAAETPIIAADGRETGLSFAAIPVAAKIPRHVGGAGPEPLGAAIAVRIRATNRDHALLYAPCFRRLDEPLIAAARRSACLMLDGSFWWEDEMARRGVGAATASAMGHLPIGGPNGSLAAIRALAGVRKIYAHINNTNPILDADSAERRMLIDAGCEVAEDGMSLEL